MSLRSKFHAHGSLFYLWFVVCYAAGFWKCFENELLYFFYDFMVDEIRKVKRLIWNVTSASGKVFN